MHSKKLRKATINFVMSVCPSAWKISGPTEGIFLKIDISVFFRKYDDDMIISGSFLRRMRYISSKFVEHIETHALYLQ